MEALRYIKKDYFTSCRNHKINTDAVIGGKYRLVTPIFYSNNIKIISNWKAYTNEYKETIRKNSFKKIKVYNSNEEHYFKTQKEVGKFIGISKQAVSSCMKNTGYHKKSGYYLKRFNIENT